MVANLEVHRIPFFQVQIVEAALHVSNAPTDGHPLCRAKQSAELLELLNLHIQNQQGGAIYVSGLPGTGKSPMS